MKPGKNNCFFLIVALFLIAQGYAQIPDVIKQEIDHRVSSGLNPSIAIAVYDKAGEHYYVYGLEDANTKKRATVNTRYLLGNLGNTLTGMLAAKLEAEGKLDLNTPLGDLVTPPLPLTDLSNHTITLLHVLTYTSGISDHKAIGVSETPDWDLLYEDDTWKQLRPYETGTRFHYSDWAIGLAANGISEKMNKKYPELIKGELLQPLGIDFHYLHPGKKLPELASSPGSAGKLFTEPDHIKGEGMQWAASVKALLHYGKSLLNPEASWKAFAETVTRTHFSGGHNIQTGLTWLKDEWGNLYHAGHAEGVNTFMAIDPKDQRVIVLATNTGNADISDLGLHVLDPTRNPITPFKKQGISPEELISYEGYYINEALGLELELKVNGGELKSIHEEDTVSLHFMGEHCFFYEGLKAHLDFEKDEQERVVGVTLNNNGQEVMFIKMN